MFKREISDIPNGPAIKIAKYYPVSIHGFNILRDNAEFHCNLNAKQGVRLLMLEVSAKLLMEASFISEFVQRESQR
jgi:hypothetical protein